MKHVTKNLQRYKTLKYRASITSCMVLLVAFCSSLNASVNLLSGDTVSIKGIIVSSTNDTTYKFVTSENDTLIKDLNSPDMNSLWQITFNDDTITFRDIVTQKYLAADASNSNILVLQSSLYNWYLYDGETKMRSAEDESLFFSYSVDTGFVAASVPTNLNIVTYSQKLKLYNLDLNAWSFLIDSLGGDTLLDISAFLTKYFLPPDTATNPLIVDTVAEPFTVVSNDAWIQINNDTMMISRMVNEEFRQGTFSIITSANSDTTTIAVSQFSFANNFNLAHDEGLSGRPLLSNGLQQVTEYVRTYFCTVGQRLSLYYPLSNGDRGAQSYYRWFNYTTLGSVTSGLSLPSSFDSFTNNKGAYNFRFNQTTVTYSVPSGALPIQIACEASNYTDYTKHGNYFYEPTLSYRAIFNLQPASVIADSLRALSAVGSAPTAYFENYNVTAPIGSTLFLSTKYDAHGSMASYYAYNSSGTLQQVTNISLYANGVKQTLNWNTTQTFQLSAINSAQQIVYHLQGELSDGTKVNIAAYTVSFVSQSLVGPVLVGGNNMLVTNTELYADYYYLAGNWYYGLTYNNPFTDWSDCNLGFAYNSTYKSIYPRRLSTHAFASAFEYQFLSTTFFAQPNYIYSGVNPVPYIPYPNYSGPQLSNGMLYVNPAGNRVNVSMASFTVDDYKSSDEFFVTLYVNNVSRYLNRSFQLTFHVEELVNGVYIPLLQYVTGSLSLQVGRWYQLGCHFRLPQPKTGLYRVRVENSGNSNMNNNYLLNQFGIYQKRSYITAYGVYNGCGSILASTKQVAVEISYDSLGLFTSSVDSLVLYCQCVDSLGTVMPLKNNTLSTTTAYGEVVMKNVPTLTANYPIFADSSDSTALMKYMTSKANSSSATGAFYVDQTNNHLFCLVLESDSINACESYKVNLYDSQTLAASSLVGSANFVPIGLCIYQLNGDETSNSINGICPSANDTITIKQQVMLGQDKFVWVNGYYDWLKGDSSSYSGNGCYANYHYDSILTALRALHTDTTYMSDKIFPTAANSFVTETQWALLDSLISRNILTLYQQTIDLFLYDTLNNFTVYAYPETMLPDDEVVALDLCDQFLTLSVATKTNTPWLTFGRYGEDYNTLGAEVQREASISEQQMNSEGFVLPVKSSGYSLVDSLVLGTMLLHTSSDTLFESYIGEVLFEHVVLKKHQDSLLLSVSSRSSAIPALKAGESYGVLIELNNGTGSCSMGYQTAQLLVQPSTLYWHGTSGGSWNNSSNWGSESSGTTSTASIANSYAALASTDIVVSQTSNPPILYPSQDADTNSSSRLKTDLTYEPNRCKNLYFAPKAMLIGQAYLQYDSVFMDIQLPTKQWVLMSAPIRGVVSGDLYVSAASSSDNLFSSLATCSGRLSIPFWQSVYNSYVESQSSGSSTTVGNVSWSNPANGMATSYLPRSGFCVWVEDYASGADTIQMRWPKSDKSYYYYNSDDTPSAISVAITRPSDYYKLAFVDSLWSGVGSITHYNDTSRMGLTGNPFMATLYAASFFKDNPHLTGSYWVVEAGAIVACSASGESTSASSEVVNIAPHQGFFVQTNSNSYFSIDSLAYNSSATYPSSTAAAAPGALPQVARLYLTAQYNGHLSHALLVEKPTASNAFLPHEDVELILFDNRMTPSAIYTIENNRALQINALSQLQRVPLGMKIWNTPNVGGRFILTCRGSDSFQKPLALFDSVTQIYHLFNDDMVLELELPTSSTARYFICYADGLNGETSVTSSSLHLFAPEKGRLVVQSLYALERIVIYDSVGRVVVEKSCHDTFTDTFILPAGVYMVKAFTTIGHEVHKVVIH